MRMGQDGLAIVKPDQNGGLEVTDPPSVDTVDAVPQSQVIQSTSVEPPQTDYEIYDEVNENKNKN